MSFFVTAVIFTSMMVPGFVSYSVLSLTHPKREHRAVALFSAISVAAGVTRSVTVGYSVFSGDLDAAIRWNLAYEASFLAFLPATPYLLNAFLSPNEHRYVRLHRILIILGGATALLYAVLLYTAPNLYFRPFALDEVPHPAAMGRGSFGVFYIIMNAQYLITIFYTVVFVFRYRGDGGIGPYMRTLRIGLLTTGLIALNVVFVVFTGSYVAKIPVYAYSRLLSALTVFSLTAVVAMAQKSAAEARELDEDRKAVRQNRDELALLAYTDDITGYRNRTALFRDIGDYPVRPAFLVVVDIDNLAFVNAYHGYSGGDELIRRVGRICEDLLPPQSFLYRVNADTFAILASGDLRDMEAMSAEILRRVRRVRLPEAQDVMYTASIGIAGSAEEGSGEAWINRANTALERAKTGRNRFVTFDPSLHADEKRRHDIIAGMRRSLDTSGFTMRYQPIVTGEGNLMGAEALLRWSHPILGPVEPGEFIPLAEGTGLITRLTQFVIGKSVEDFCDSPNLRPDLRVNVNLSGRDVVDRNLLANLSDITVDGRGESLLGFEVTETDLVVDLESSTRNLRGLRDRGYSVALDDFGTGYSSLSYLNDLPLDKLKIDRSFIADLPEDSRKVVLLETIVGLGRRLNLDLIVEGVENQRQLDFLKSMDCRMFQGYHFAPPMDIAAFRRWAGDGLGSGPPV